jgi:hypothetical protein
MVKNQRAPTAYERGRGRGMSHGVVEQGGVARLLLVEGRAAYLLSRVAGHASNHGWKGYG